MNNFTLPSLIAFAISCLPVRAETVLFHDNFNGSDALHHTTPDVTTGGAVWTAAPVFGAAGLVTGGLGGASATLPLTPLDGFVYTLEASFENVGLLGTDDRQWIALGFTNGQSVLTGGDHRFISGSVIGRAWMLFRGTGALFDNNTFLASTNGGQVWANWPTFPAGVGGAVQMRVVLDTTGGAGGWTARYFAKRPADADFAEVRAATPVSNPAITSVGIARSSDLVNATLTRFSLTVSGGGPPPVSTPEPIVSFIPVSDENPATDENGYAGAAINSISFAQNNLITVGNRQFIAYYRRHATNPTHPANNTIILGRRTVGSSQWELFSTNLVSYNINDNHNVISMAIDGTGFLHLSWGMHAHPLLYGKSTTPVLGGEPIIINSLGTAGMTGQEATATYPMFQRLPGGDLLFLYRRVGSGNGDWYLNRYHTASASWSPVHANSSGTAQPLFKGTGFTLTNCAYPDRFTLGPDGMLHISAVFRYNSSSQAGQSGYQTNHRYVYMRSPDNGLTWQRSDGSPVRLPAINNAAFLNLGPTHVPEIVKDIPEGHSLMNMAGMTTDSAGRPIIANWWSEKASTGDHTRQYYLLFHDGTAWHQRTLSARTLDSPTQKFSEAQLGTSWMGRPVVLTDAEDRIIVLYNDNRFDGITVVFSEPLAADPGRNRWTRMNLTHENLGGWEVNYDEPRWKQDGVLQMLYQKLPGSGMVYTSVNNSTPVSVVEWNARGWFNGPVRWELDHMSTPGQATIKALTQPGFRYHLRTATALEFNAPPAASIIGDGTWREFGSWPMNEPRRFWNIERLEEASGGL